MFKYERNIKIFAYDICMTSLYCTNLECIHVHVSCMCLHVCFPSEPPSEQYVHTLCTAPLLSQMLHRFTKQIAANQIRALSRAQTQGEEWRNSVCVCVSGGGGGGGSLVALRGPG